jgi:hypothetical protein
MHNEPEVIKLMECWWEQINVFSYRDQISLMYCVWKNNISISIIKELKRGNSYFSLKPHLYEYSKGSKKFFKNMILEWAYNYPYIVHSNENKIRKMLKLSIKLINKKLMIFRD